MSGAKYANQNSTAGSIAPAHSVYGSPVTATARPNATQSTVGAATWSTAPYKPPPRRHRDNPNLKLCAEEGCKGYPIKDLGFCAGHARTHGYIKTCPVKGCKRAAPVGETICVHHQENPPDGDAD